MFDLHSLVLVDGGMFRCGQKFVLWLLWSCKQVQYQIPTQSKIWHFLTIKEVNLSWLQKQFLCTVKLFFILPFSIDLTIGFRNTQQQVHFKRVSLLNILKKHLTVHHCLIHIDNGSQGFSIVMCVCVSVCVCVCVCVFQYIYVYIYIYIYTGVYIYNVLILCYPIQGHFRRWVEQRSQHHDVFYLLLHCHQG